MGRRIATFCILWAFAFRLLPALGGEGIVSYRVLVDQSGNWRAAAVDSLRGKARIGIGGQARMAWYYARYDQGVDPDPAAAFVADPAGFAARWNQRRQNAHTGQFRTRDAELDFRVEAADNATLFIRLDLDDAWKGRPEQDDFLEMAYFEWRRLGGGGLSLRLGKQEMPYGLHRDDLLVAPWAVGREMPGIDGWFNNYNGAGNQTPGKLDNVFGLAARYDFLRDLAGFEIGLFQNRDGRRPAPPHFRRTGDDFGSLAARLTLAPLEQAALHLSFANLHNRAAAARPGGRASQQWFSAGFTGKMLTLAPLEFFAEYQYGTGTNHLDGGRAHNVHAGLVWNIAGRWRLNWQGEWLRASSRRLYAASPAAGAAGPFTPQRIDLFRALMAAEYDLAEHLTLETGWQHEWMRSRYDRLAIPGGDHTRHRAGGDLIYAGLKMRF